MPTDDQIEEIQKRVEAATPGPWYWRQDYELSDGYHWELASPESDAEGKTIDASLIVVLEHSLPTWFQRPCNELPNWQFIAHARTDIPYLLTLYHQQRERIESLKAAVKRARTDFEILITRGDLTEEPRAHQTLKILKAAEKGEVG